MSDLIVFALLGVLVGAAARVFYPGRHPGRILGTVVLGAAGALLGGVLSRAYWPAVEGQFAAGALLTSGSAAVLVVVLWAGVAYAHRLSAPRDPA